MQELAGLSGLFVAAFVAATIFPMQSEAVLVALLLSGGYGVVALLAVATIGNVLGAVLNWLLGGYLEHFRNRRWFPVGDKALMRAQHWYQRYGYWSLLLGWAPFGGDALTVVAGIMREPLWRFLLMVTIAKGGRYAAYRPQQTTLLPTGLNTHGRTVESKKPGRRRGSQGPGIHPAGAGNHGRGARRCRSGQQFTFATGA